MANHKDKVVDLSSLYFDPYFMEKTQEVVNFCKKYNKPYVTIDSRHDIRKKRTADEKNEILL